MFDKTKSIASRFVRKCSSASDVVTHASLASTATTTANAVKSVAESASVYASAARRTMKLIPTAFKAHTKVERVRRVFK